MSAERPVLENTTAWHTLGASVRGPSHDASGRPNQDAFALCEDGPIVVLAVSDGHGDALCVRSHRGSEFAVTAAVATLRRRVGITVPLDGPASARLAQELLTTWRRAVARDLAAYPFTNVERLQVECNAGSGAFAHVERDPYLAYGATLLGVLVTAAVIVYAQIGDGDLLTVDADGTARRVFEKEPGLAMHQTHSLCYDDAWRRLRVEATPAKLGTPSTIVAASDGYANSYRTDADFLCVGTDVQALVRAHGVDAVAKQLPVMLASTTREGSGDDITVAIATQLAFLSQKTFPR